MKKHRPSKIIAIPGQRFKNLRGGREEESFTGCVGYDENHNRVDNCGVIIPAQSGVLEPRCDGCYRKYIELYNKG